VNKIRANKITEKLGKKGIITLFFICYNFIQFYGGFEGVSGNGDHVFIG
jgi:hypothetical protein